MPVGVGVHVRLLNPSVAPLRIRKMFSGRPVVRENVD